MVFANFAQSANRDSCNPVGYLVASGIVRTPVSWSMQYASVYGVQGAVIHQDLQKFSEPLLRYDLQYATTFSMPCTQFKGTLCLVLLLRACPRGIHSWSSCPLEGLTMLLRVQTTMA